MKTRDAIVQMLRNLQADNIESTPRFVDEITALVDTDVLKFIKVFAREIKIININEYNKFEELNVSKKEKIKLGKNKLYRYEYRRSNKNIRCIFVLEREDGRRVLLKAFKEDGDKTKGDDNYDTNIKLALKEYFEGGAKYE